MQNTTLTQHLVAEPINLVEPAKIHRPRTAKWAPRTTGEPFDPAKVTRNPGR